ncbi:hypothetical protein RBH26_12835 [Natronolimnohabitans sp. A-GB9]|uniref:hypothetical protein n=1 Tax=Natronolimnohabitans sp. A-GB9 TaxID=3069757 RepID=UPI0027B2751D|nr:hypothetical protein [Natronolimnohabitans sp. A-GB9]MDQ2051362.1 hypothetical protein [Natronolimnohabitans sp. A-GB9]
MLTAVGTRVVVSTTKYGTTDRLEAAGRFGIDASRQRCSSGEFDPSDATPLATTASSGTGAGLESKSASGIVVDELEASARTCHDGVRTPLSCAIISPPMGAGLRRGSASQRAYRFVVRPF